MTGEPTLFDLLDFEREAVAATPWQGAPLAYSAEYHDPADLVAAFERFKAERGDFACIPRSHMWHKSAGGIEDAPAVDGHDLHLFHADGWCREADHDHSAAPLPGEGMHQAVCGRCQWHHIAPSWQTVVEALHDHALPGWRALPVVPAKLCRFDSTQATAALTRWTSEHYPESWQRPGAPIITPRGEHGRRHVPGRSPFGGFDLAAD